MKIWSQPSSLTVAQSIPEGTKEVMIMENVDNVEEEFSKLNSIDSIRGKTRLSKMA